MKKRAFSIDAFRGLAVIAMILSGQMVLSHMPAWMAHAQVPPNSSFDPSIYGITWVDLVFPFFLFAMGASFPFSLGNKLTNGENKWLLCWNSLVRAVQLVFFAVFFQHMKPFVIDSPVTISSCLISITAFGLMFFMFVNDFIPFIKNIKFGKLQFSPVKLIAYLFGFGLMYFLNFEGKKTNDFDIFFSDIIIIVLANMAFFASVIYIFTFKKPYYRLLILPFVMAVFLSTSGWVKMLYNFTPAPWAYSFYYLKYLFIVIPGSFAGEYIYQWSNSSTENNSSISKHPYLLGIISLTLIIANVYLLFVRQMELNILITIALLLVSYFILKNDDSSFGTLWKRLFSFGAYCLLLGLFLESYQGGIRKDDSTYSYYFVTSGLAFFAMIALSIICDYFKSVKSVKILVMTGQNPMIAYVAVALVVMPVLTLTSLTDYFSIFNESAFMGFLRGVLITGLSILITMFFSKIKWFWRT